MIEYEKRKNGIDCYLMEYFKYCFLLKATSKKSQHNVIMFNISKKIKNSIY
mgnify:CR=1 FL=1